MHTNSRPRITTEIYVFLEGAFSTDRVTSNRIVSSSAAAYGLYQ